ncbi:MAG: hypothetical protein OXG38_12000 [Chloroflexi bacterium]|nr:hypothetical protein [Chloroflexota bacterium]
MVGLALVGYREIADGGIEIATLIAIGESLGPLVLVMAAITVILVEGGAMIAERYQKIRFEAGLAQGLEQGLAQGQEQGQEEERAQWVAWNRRRLAAEERGERFTEPPPATDNGQTAQDA